MPEIPPTTQLQPGPNNPNPGAPPPGNPPANNPPPPGNPPGDPPQRDIHTLSAQSIKRMKEEQRKKGEDAANAQREADAKKRGFLSYQAMLDHMDSLRGQRPPKAPRGGGNGPPGDPSDDPAAPLATDPPNTPISRKGAGRWDKEINRLTRSLETERAGRLELTNRSKRLQGELDALQARSALEKTAIRAGVRDVDYALLLLQRHLEGARLSDDQLEKFDYTAFFEGMKKSHPYVFGEVVKPANSGNPNNEPPPPPPGNPPPGGGGVNFMAKDDKGKLKVDDATYREQLRKRGLDTSLIQ